MTVQSEHRPATAEVVVLTATVRALMVGSRQVTLSVFAQLDLVKWDDLVPMGRVRARDHDGRWAIGADRGGNLVKAQIRDRYYAASIEDLEKQWQRLDPIPEAHRTDERMLKYYADKKVTVTRELDEQKQLQRTLEAQIAEWEALPLIVLAGLR